MVRKLFLFWILLCTVFVWSAPLQYLTRTTPAATSLDTHTGGATTWNAGDNDWTQANIGFSFPFNGSTYTSVYINSNGMLSFNSSNTEYSNEALPYSDEPQSVYPYWDDLHPGGIDAYILFIRATLGAQPIRYETFDSGGPNERFVVSWIDMPECSVYAYIPLLGLTLCTSLTTNKYTFQVVLYKNGDIRFRYPSGGNLANGASATIGTQENTTNYDQYSYNSSSIDQTFDILYTLKPLIAKTSIVISDPVNSTTNPKRIPGATVRYCFQVDNTGLVSATNVVLTEDFTTNNKDKLTYVKSGYVVQDISTSCNCASISNTSGSFSTPTVTINIGTLAGSTSPSTSRGCAYIEATID